MKFVLIDATTKKKLIFPIAPETLKVQIGTKTQTFDSINLGDIELPRGRVPIKFSMSGLLPGPNQNVPKRYSDLDPEDIVKQIRKWSEEKRASGKKLRFLVTGTNWNIPVSISTFNPELSGGLGDVNYTLELTEYRDFTVKEIKSQSSGKKKVRETKPKPKSYTIKPGDNLWNIARKYTGKGIKWTEMWSLNKGKSKSKNPNLIYPGEKFTIPSGWLS
ncbi:LysM peptidoglycan-binding domain-containing protein [Rummeliibacillus sp. POC4]|uniref:LysM peptidoglycan-binding domain-containing protein n=1 Tax=Rummeliibacillus sp. POC4 TaxID=2305899 RepID=UPI000E676582|nr:LysM peptidoglycan-binding domain-containing protein [Rummeliibacillus sp. POC4]RIJ63601.1 LysM peptidoglycan-binding domain-containing protein [Rummeliibacillus sp. POC4]